MVDACKFTIAEQFVVGAILKHPKAALTILAAQKCNPEWFEQPVSHCCMRAIYQLLKKNIPVEPATILQAIHDVDASANIVFDDLQHCMKMCSSTSYLLQHVLSLKDRSQRKEIEQILSVSREKLENGIATQDIVQELNWMIKGLSSPTETNADDVIADLFATYSQAAAKGFTGVPSRWMELNNIMGGYKTGGVTGVSGLTKNGKTTLACNEVLGSCRQGYRNLFISLEMSKGEIRAILAGDEMDIDLMKLRNGKYPRGQQEIEFKRFKECVMAQKELPLTIVDGSKTIEDIDSLIRGAKGEFDRIIIDHLHLIKQCPRDSKNKEERISNYSNTITNSTVDSKVNTMLLAQLSRDGLVNFKGEAVAPQPSNLKGSGSIEQDLSQLVFVYQDPSLGRDLVPDQAPTHVKVALNRGGTTGKIEMVFLKSKQKLITKEMWDLHEAEAHFEGAEDTTPF